jgi:UDP-N-acetylglucosamine diphosphorylase/glucosamine-1-phosphate N-acetyltransferase
VTANVVLFEDQTWRGLRPLASAQPSYEQRCGLFNTRERVELGGGAGVLLCRPVLEALHPVSGLWQLGVASLAALPPDAPARLWLAGRLAPSCALAGALSRLAQETGTPSFAWFDGEGLVAALLGPAECRAAAASWTAWRDGGAAAWEGPVFGAGAPACECLADHRLICAPGTADETLLELAGRLATASGGQPAAWRRPWDIVPRTVAALAGDLAAALAVGGWRRHPFGLHGLAGAEPLWSGRSELHARGAGDLPPGVWLQGDGLWCGRDVVLAPGVVVDARRGPVVIDRGCDIAPHALLEGPLYLGPGCRVKAGARLYGESSFGIGNRLAGEIGESTFGDFANKQHEGFIGHAVLGSWTNLGALTTCSDLKNNYGSVRVDLGDGAEDTGQRFVGLLAGDHVKTAIGTLFNTGTTVGFATNIFGGGMPPKCVPAFSWGGAADAPAYAVAQAAATAAVVMDRRGCRFLPAHRALFEAIAAGG